MLFIIANLLIKLFGINDVKANRIARWLFAGIAILVVLIIAGLVFKACGGRKVKLDEKAIQVAQQAIAENDRKVMIEVLTNSDVAEKKIDANLANAKSETVNAIVDAKKKAAALSNEELRLELERRASQ